MMIPSQAEAGRTEGAWLAAIQTGDVDSRGLAGFMTLEQQPLRIGEELGDVWNHSAGGNWALLSYAGGQKYQVRRRHILAQHQRPGAVG
jgi:hypothetical protein